MVSFQTRLEMLNSNVYGYNFPITAEITDQFVEGNNRRVICLINDQIELRSSLMPKKEGGSYLLINNEVRKKLNIELGSEVRIQLQKDRSQYGIETPEELMVLLDQEPEASRLFHDLTPGKQRSLMYLVNKVKNVDSRLNKALAIVHHLKEVNGQLDYKLLNETIKFYNSRGKLNR